MGSSVIELAKLTQKIIPVLILERRRLEFAMAHWDKEGKREIEKSLLHLYFDLHDLNEQLPQITGEVEEPCKWEYEQWFYSNHENMTEEEVQKKLIEFYGSLQRMRKALDDVIKATSGIAPNKFISHLAGHIFLTSTLMKFDIERLTGVELNY